MDTSHWPQEIVVKPIEEIISNVYKKPQNQQNQLTPSDSEQRKPTTATTKQPQQKGQQVINCPRCNSTNTKFCYYNNYSLTQPRYFCKTCRRYWTEGGSLRNIPVGGATRKNSNNKRLNSSSTSSNSSSPSKKLHISSVSLEHHPHPHAKLVQNQNHGQDLNLTFPSSQHFRSIGEFSQLSTIDQNNVKGGDNNGGASNTSVSAMELLNGMQDSRGFSTFIPMPNLDTINTIYSSGYHSNMSNLSNLHEFKPSLNFSLDHHNHNGYNGNFQDHHQGPGNGGGGGGRSLFPFEDLKQVSNATTTNVSGVEQINNNRGGGNVDSSGGYWSGMLGGGSW